MADITPEVAQKMWQEWDQLTVKLFESWYANSIEDDEDIDRTKLFYHIHHVYGDYMAEDFFEYVAEMEG